MNIAEKDINVYVCSDLLINNYFTKMHFLCCVIFLLMKKAKKS